MTVSRFLGFSYVALGSLGLVLNVVGARGEYTDTALAASVAAIISGVVLAVLK